MDDKQNDGWEEVGEGGRQLKRSTDGRISGSHITPAVARQMGAGRTRNKTAKHESDINQLLKEAGYPDPAQAPAHLRHLAEMATSGKSGSVSAITRFVALTRQDKPADEVQLGIGDLCPVCGQYNMDLDGELLLQLLDLLQQLKKLGTDDITVLLGKPVQAARAAAPAADAPFPKHDQNKQGG